MVNNANNFNRLYARAEAAGKAAAEAAQPQMIAVRENKTGRVFGPFPICGFAWVNVRPGTSSFAKWLKKKGLARAAYRGGVDIWIGAYNQAYDLKMAHARAMAEVLREAEINAYPDGRLD